MEFPLSTGQVAKLLKVAEHRITSQERLGKVSVQIVCGRRAWGRAEVLKVAKITGTDSVEVRNACGLPTPAFPKTLLTWFKGRRATTTALSKGVKLVEVDGHSGPFEIVLNAGSDCPETDKGTFDSSAAATAAALELAKLYSRDLDQGAVGLSIQPVF